ncbi:DUF4440 domain-containing protein [Solimonas fluminis]|uniref:DUF4440 domain-containing protein n=1 Tax=Solimonas fluminis TaxID=2086571 RepID=A0A2S5TH37_9GAMM|nr:nuclear transport factor 2 family protein [Solimonas fluminis]PPE74262.1 DUF4440 domain-containing protein [Solimonas fluminis]
MDALIEIEAIRQLKARYCRLLDLKDWSAWRELFTEDFISDTSESGGPRLQGADEFVAFVRDTLGAPRRTTVHMVHAPEIELLSETAARGIWMLEDLIRFAPGLGFRGHGHYHETYKKQDGRWMIASSRLTRLREDIVTPFFSLQVSGWLRRQSIKAGQRHSAAWLEKRRRASR